MRLGKRGYSIYIGNHLVAKLGCLLKIKSKNTPIFIISNKKILKLHGAALRKGLRPLTKNLIFHTTPDSEKAKSFGVYKKTMAVLSKKTKKATPFIIAFGGGVVGDLAGFVASTYRRGVPYAQIPTTLLAQVDSAIGGKVALDIKEAKNIVGSFYQPQFVLCDLGFLDTLPLKELKNGLVEVVKCAVIKDAGLFALLEKNLSRIIKREKALLEAVVLRTAAIKARIVEKDEFDNRDIRAVLNFGHTFGHAIEASACYTKSISHGDAVARGMIMASFVARELRMLEDKDYKRIISLIQRLKGKKVARLNVKKVLRSLAFDKKFTKGTNKFILPKKIGCAKPVEKVPRRLIRKTIER